MGNFAQKTKTFLVGYKLSTGKHFWGEQKSKNIFDKLKDGNWAANLFISFENEL